MLTIAFRRAAGKYAFLAFWAVLFCSPILAQDSSLNMLESGLNDLIYRLSRSVVTVESFYPRPASIRSGAGGDALYNVIATGVIFDSSGHVLTVASNVVNRSRIQIRFEDQTVPAEVQAIDYQTGLAVLRLARPVGTPARLNRQHGCAGQMILALGNAYGLRAAPSMGFCAGVRPDGAVQFTAPITSSTLGGGLFDLSGQLVGLITGGIGQGNRTEIGLAVPSARVSESAEYLLARGDRMAGYLGLSTAEMEVYPPLEIGQSSQLVNDGSGGMLIERAVVITAVVPSSPAAKAGLKVGDLLFSVNRQAVPSAFQVANFVKQSMPGTVIELGIIRQNRSYFVPVKVGQAQTRSFESSISVSFERVEYFDLTDSLLGEIEALKATIRHLERRIR
ncbi:MAG: serine protease [Candidatus Zixiibacteriota bacterium]|nr:MAG: serine protease [candidate division Zixibacteria bacterium]